MTQVLITGAGGQLAVAASGSVLVDRADGGHLIVTPRADVWERSELPAADLFAWSALVAAAGRAMMDALPQLAGGCVNYWEAGNWALHDNATPAGPKIRRNTERFICISLAEAAPPARPHGRGAKPLNGRSSRIGWTGRGSSRR